MTCKKPETLQGKQYEILNAEAERKKPQALGIKRSALICQLAADDNLPDQDDRPNV